MPAPIAQVVSAWIREYFGVELMPY